jgi:hypothetical protein
VPGDASEAAPERLGRHGPAVVDPLGLVDPTPFGYGQAVIAPAGGPTVTPVATSRDSSMSAITSGERPHRTFLLDPAGRPQVPCSDRNHLVEPDHYGTFWMSCEDACAERANWTETDLARHAAYDAEIFDDPSLAVDPQGRPRVASRIFAFGEAGADAPDGLCFLACDAGCTRPANRKRVWIVDAGSGSLPSPSWPLAIDPQGRPRIAFFAGDVMAQADLPHTLIHLWCDAANRLASDDHWTGTVVAAGAHGEGAGLALTAEGRPAVACDVSVQGRGLCHEDGTPEANVTYEFHEAWRAARVATFAA